MTPNPRRRSASPTASVPKPRVPAADVFWNNEVLNTLQLKHEGLLQPCRPDQAENYPPQYRDPDGFWYGFAARAPRDHRQYAARQGRGVTQLDPRSDGTALGAPRGDREAPVRHHRNARCLLVRATRRKSREAVTRRASRRTGSACWAATKPARSPVGAGQLAAALTDTDDAIAELGRPQPQCASSCRTHVPTRWARSCCPIRWR